MKRLFLTLLLILLSVYGCQSTPKNPYKNLKALTFGKIDNSEKNITIRTGGDYFLIKIKYVLSKHGWDIENYYSSEITEKENNKEFRKADIKTRYTLVLNYSLTTGTEYVDGKFVDDYVILPSLTLVDNKTRSDILIISSKGGTSTNTFARYFHEKLNEIENNSI